MTASLDSLKGSIPPLVTPFRNGEVDYEAYGKLVEYQIRNGSHGILVNGTTSEPSSLSVDERNRLVDVAVQVAAKRVHVCAATGSQSLRESQQLTEAAAKAGADSLEAGSDVWIAVSPVCPSFAHSMSIGMDWPRLAE